MTLDPYYVDNVLSRDNAVASHGCMFMLLGKSASTSVKRALIGSASVDPHDDDRLRYVSRDECARSAGPVITVLRNPVDRVVSFWWDKVGREGSPHRMWSGLIEPPYGLQETIDWIERSPGLNDYHVMPAWRLLCDDLGRYIPTHTVHFEDLRSGWASLAKELGLPPLPHLNHGTPAGVIDRAVRELPEQVERLRRIYHMDIKMIDRLRGER